MCAASNGRCRRRPQCVELEGHDLIDGFADRGCERRVLFETAEKIIGDGSFSFADQGLMNDIQQECRELVQNLS